MLKEVEGVEVTLRGEGTHQTKCCIFYIWFMEKAKLGFWILMYCA